MGEVDRGICTDCAGSGLVELETFDLDFDDLEQRTPWIDVIASMTLDGKPIDLSTVIPAGTEITIQVVPPGSSPYGATYWTRSHDTKVLWNAGRDHNDWKPDPTAGSAPATPKCPDCGGDPRTCECIPW